MWFIIKMTLLNIAFWFILHFGIAGMITALPHRVTGGLLNPDKPFFRVRPGEMRFYRRIGLPRWKDRLPQHNSDFDKRHLAHCVTEEYLSEYLFITCKAEIIHYLIAVFGFLSLLFSLLCDDPAENLPIFFWIALIIGACNIPFSLIQRYNRCRLLHVQELMRQRATAE